MENNESSVNRRLKILFLYKIFYEFTDENHSLSLQQIAEKLSEYGVNAERKALYADIEALRKFGLDIILANRRYYLGSRIFELPELKLLADAVCSARFLTEKKSNALLKKIESLAGVYEGKLLHRQVYVIDRVKSMNERIYINVDTINRAIIENRQISFRYFDYGLDKRPVYRDGVRVASPIAMTWDNEKYYMIAYYLKYPEALTNFRVDRMTDIQILEEAALNPPKKFELAEYMNATFSMFSGETEETTLKFHKTLINAVLDRFGNRIPINRIDENYFSVTVNVRAEPPFFAWLFQFGSKASIVSPPGLRKKYADMLESVMGSLMANG